MRLIVIAGPPGVGKTAVREVLKPLLGQGAVAASPDDVGGSWPVLYKVLDSAIPTVLIECRRLPNALRQKITEREATVVELTAPEDVRRERLQQRGETAERIAELLSEDGLGLGYEDEMTPDLRIETTGSPGDIAREILKHGVASG